MNQHYAAIHIEYIHWLSALGYSKSTQGICSNAMKLFFNWLDRQNIMKISRLQETHIQSYYDYLLIRPNQRFNRGLSDSYLNKQYDAVDKLLTFLHQQGSLKLIPPTGYRIKTSDMQKVLSVEPFTESEIKLLMDSIPSYCESASYLKRESKEQQLNLLFILFYGCGLRRKEGFALTMKDIDFNDRKIYIRQSKNYKDRIIPLNTNLFKALEDYCYNFRNLQKTNHSCLFINSDITMVKWLKKLQLSCNDEKLKQKRLSFHILRHSIATHLLQNGMSIETIAQFLGHSSLESTQIYTHFLE